MLLTVRRGHERRHVSALTPETDTPRIPAPFRGCFHAIPEAAFIPASGRAGVELRAPGSFLVIPDSSVGPRSLRDSTPHQKDAGRPGQSDTHRAPVGAQKHHAAKNGLEWNVQPHIHRNVKEVTVSVLFFDAWPNSW